MPGYQLNCVIKGDAYGHGAVQVARTLREAGADYFSVAMAEEALQLRRHGIYAYFNFRDGCSCMDSGYA